MFKYKIVEENKNDSIKTVVSKTGLVAEFCLEDVYNHKLKVEQDIKEKKSKIELAKASMKNIEENHKDVAQVIKDIKQLNNSEGILATLYLWIKEDIERDTNERMVKEREELIKEYEEELNTIHTKLGIPKPLKVSYTKANQ